MSDQDVKAPINSNLLIWARKNSGLEFEGIIHKLKNKIKKISPTLLLEWESGKDRPTLQQLKILADLYKRPIAMFFLSRTPTEDPLPKDFRTIDSKDNNEYVYKLRLAIRWARRVQGIALTLLSDENEGIKFKYKKYSLSDHPVTLAEQIRVDFQYNDDIQKKIKSESDVFNFLRNKIEKTGVIVLKTPPQYSFPISEARALSFVDKFPYLILVNNKDITSAKNFSLLHEFAHILLRETSLCDVEYHRNNNSFVSRAETFCNQFAASFLIPDRCIFSKRINSSSLKNRTTLDAVLSSFSHEFKVSKHVILLKLLNLSLIDQSTYKNVVSFWNRKKPQHNKSFGKNIPHEVSLKSNGHTYTGLVLEAYKQSKITFSDASDYLNLKSKYLPKLERLMFGG